MSSRHELPPQIRRVPEVTLTAAEIALLVRAFASSHEIFIERELRSGYSGAVVLLLSTGSGQAQIVAKLGPPADLQREYAAYRQFVEPSLSQNTARLWREPLLAEDGQLAILCYTFAGGDPRLPNRSLQAYYDSQRGQATAAVLDRIFRVYGRQWWANNRPQKFTLSEQYDQLLPAHLKLKPVSPIKEQAAEVSNSSEGGLILQAGQVSATTLRSLPPGQRVRLCDFRISEIRPYSSEITLTADPPPGEASAPLRLRLETDQGATYQLGDRLETLDAIITVTRSTLLAEAARSVLPSFDPDAPFLSLAGRTYPNPLLDLTSLLDRVVEAKVSIIHGDLNLQNILVDEATGFAWLIDFAETRLGPTLFDLQRLEGQVITKLLPPAVAQAGLGVTVIADLLETLHADPPRPLAPHSALQESYTILVMLRRLARQYLIDDRDWDEYYLGLVVVLLGMLKFPELKTLARGLALVGAAVAWELHGKPLATASLTTVSHQLYPPPSQQTSLIETPVMEPYDEQPQRLSQWLYWIMSLGDWFKPKSKPELPLALLINVQGWVEVRRKTSDRVLPAAFGMHLFFEDAVITYEASTADLMCQNGFLFHLDGQSALTVRCGVASDRPPLGRLPIDLSERISQPGATPTLMTQVDLAAAEQAIYSLPLSTPAQNFLLAKLYHNNGSLNEAIVKLEELASQRQEPGLAQALGDAYHQAGLLDDAQVNYITALNEAFFRGDPVGQAEAHVSLGRIAQANNAVQVAVNHWQKAETLYRQEKGYYHKADQIAELLPPVQPEGVNWLWLKTATGHSGGRLKKVWQKDSKAPLTEKKEAISASPSTKYRWAALGLVSLVIILLIGSMMIGIFSQTPAPTALAVVLPTSTFTLTSVFTPTLSPTPMLMAEVTSTIAPTSTPSPRPGPAEGVPIADLPIYSGPGTIYTPMGNVLEGTRVELRGIDNSGNWILISWPAGYGWVDANFIEVMSSLSLPVLTPLPPPTFTPTQTFTPVPTTPTVTYTPLLGSPTAGPDVPRELVSNTSGYQVLDHQAMAFRDPTSAAFSPNGAFVAATDGANLYTIWREGIEPHIWEEEDEKIRPVEDIVWSPTGTLIAFVADLKRDCISPACSRVGIVLYADLGREPTYLSPPEGYGMRFPRWTQDGRLLVTIYKDDPANGTIYVYNTSGQGQVAEGTYVLSSSSEGQKWYPWLPGKTWTVNPSRPTSYYND